MSKLNLQIDGKIKSTTEGNDIWWYGGGDVAYSSLANAKAGVPLAIRSGKTVGVLENGKVVEYIWNPDDLTDSGLVPKQNSLPDNVAFTDIDNNFTENQTFKEATFERVFSNNEATANNELVRLDQLNSAVSGLNWKDPIEDILDFTTSEPTSPTIGDRYINSANGTSSGTGQSVTKDNIYEWDGSDWAEFTPLDGWTVFDRAVDQNFTFNGTSWVEFGSTVSHNNTTGLQGGVSGQYYHLTEAQYLALSGGIDSATLQGQNGAYYLNYNNFSNVPDLSGFLVASDISGKANKDGGNNFTGNQAINGIISANNLSGTNTGNETKASIDALGVDAATLQGQNGAYYLDYNNFSNKPTIDNYGYFQLQTNSINRKQIAAQNILNFINGTNISITYSSNGAVTINNTTTNNNQLTNGRGYVTEADVNGLGFAKLSGGNTFSGDQTISGNVEINGGVGASTNGTLVVRQNGNTVDNGIAIIGSNPSSHRIWKDASGFLNIGTTANNKQIILGLDGNATFSGDVNINKTLNVKPTPDLGILSGDKATAITLNTGRQNVSFESIRTANGADWNNTTFRILADIDTTPHQSINFVNDGGYSEHIDIYTGNQVFNTRFTSDGNVEFGGNATFSGSVEVANTNGGVLNLKSTDTSIGLDQLIGGLTFEASNAIVGGIRMKKNTVINDPNGLGSRLDFSVGSVSGYDVMALSLTSTKATFSVDIQAQGYKSADGSEGITSTFTDVTGQMFQIKNGIITDEFTQP